MEVNQKKAEAAMGCFEFNKNLNTVHVTSDLECFGERSHAVNHARDLEDSSIDVFERDVADVEWNEHDSKSFSNEAFTIPDYDVAKAKAEGSGLNDEFEQNAPPAVQEPAVEQTPVIEQSSVMDTLHHVVDAVLGVFDSEPGEPAIENVQDSEPVVEPVLTPVQKMLNTLDAKKAAAAEEAQEVK